MKMTRWERLWYGVRGLWHGVPAEAIYHIERVGFVSYPECIQCGREVRDVCRPCLDEAANSGADK